MPAPCGRPAPSRPTRPPQFPAPAGATSTVDLRVRTFSGATRWVRFTARPEYDATGKRVVRIHGAGKDISDVKALEAIALRNEGSQSPTGESGRGA